MITDAFGNIEVSGIADISGIRNGLGFFKCLGHDYLIIGHGETDGRDTQSTQLIKSCSGNSG